MIRRFVIFFASRSLLTIGLWAALLVFGIASYFSLLPREGFPSVDVPIALGSGTWFVDDTDMVDEQVVTPLLEQLADTTGIASTSSVARENSFTLITELDQSISSADGARLIEEAIAKAELPASAAVAAIPIDVSKFLEEFDLLIGVAGPADATAAELEEIATKLLPTLDARPELVRSEVVNLIDRGVDPATGDFVERETSFNQLTTGDTGSLTFRPSVAIGVVAADGIDSLNTRDAADLALADAQSQSLVPDGFVAEVALDQATQIRQQIGSLQNNVITGIIAVALVALLLISWRASIITALFIISVMATTFGVLYLIGISLNTISLFGVIIALGLFVDDSIVITEAIDQFREGEEGAEPDERVPTAERVRAQSLAIIGHAIDRVGAASVSGTLTTVLVFAPMLAISGILGEFIRILPISVIVALLVSLLLSLVFIPLAARFLVLSAPASQSPLSRLSDRVARGVGALPGTRGKKGVVIGAIGVLISLAMTAVGLLVFAPNVGFNIFPPQKDSQYVQLSLNYEPGTTIEQARDISTEINDAAMSALGSDIEQIYTYTGNVRSSFSQYLLSPIGGRTVAPEIVDEVLQPLADNVDGARAVYTMLSAGPPDLLFPFQMQVFDEDPAVLMSSAAAIVDRLDGADIARPAGTTFTVLETDVALLDAIARDSGRRYIEVRARFDADDVTTTTAETQAFIESQFDDAELAQLGLAPDAFGFDFGLESDNQESFASMPRAFMIALVLMLILLIIQFRSAVQWFLVFLAIPFSFFGVFGGLLLTDNQISFFVMLGLLGLIGIAVNNTILLTDFANQERRAGADRKQAISVAMQRRFRPLIATSLTTVAGVLPLALSDPFWEALGFTIIFGLLSSTFLVLVSFPYYYLAIEWLRDKTKGLFRRDHRSVATA